MSFKGFLKKGISVAKKVATKAVAVVAGVGAAVVSSVSAHAEDTVVSTAVDTMATNITTYVGYVVIIGIASLGVVLAVKAFSWLKSAIK